MLSIPSYPNPYATTPITNAVGWISFLALDFSTPVPSGRVVLNVNADAQGATQYKPPIVQKSYSLGQVLRAEIPGTPEIPGNPGDPNADPPVPPTEAVPAVPGVPAIVFPSFADLLGDPEFAQAFGVIRAKLYAAVAVCPCLEGATPL